jgi:hypothetical protein
MDMLKTICFKIIMIFILSLLWLGQGDKPALAAEVEFSKGSTLEGILERGELRIGLEVGYMPFEMIDKRSGLRQKKIRHGGLRRKGRQLSLKLWGSNRYLSTPYGPGLSLPSIWVVLTSFSAGCPLRRNVRS